MRPYDKVGKFGWYSLLEGTDRQDYGHTWFVDSNGGGANNANTGNGSSWAAPFLTLNYAISRCSDDAGDVIFVAAGHAENMSATLTESGVATTGVCVDKSGVTIIGLGTADRRPTFTTTAAAGTFNILDTECTVSNILFKSAYVDTAALITLGSGGDGAIIEACEFRDSSAITEYIMGIHITAACNDVTIRGCRFLSTDTASATNSAVWAAGAIYRLVVQDCYFRGDWGGGSSDAVIDGATAAGFDFLIDGNIINNMDPTYGACINLHATTTGAVTNNACYSTAAAKDIITAVACIRSGNTETSLLTSDALNWHSDKAATKTYVNWTAAKHTLFTVTGPVRVNYIAGVVMATIKTATMNINLDATTTDPGGDLAIASAVDTNADAVGTLYTLNATPAGALVATTIGAVADETEGFFMNTGAITMECGAEEDGNGSIQWSVSYTPLSPNARILPATTD